MTRFLSLAAALLIAATACSSPTATPTAPLASPAAAKTVTSPVPANVASPVQPTVAPSPSVLAIASPSAVTAASPVAASGAKFTMTEGSEARFKVREQLAGNNLPNDAIGKTSGVSGSVTFNAAGAVVPDQSTIEVDLTKLTTDESRRQGAISQTLETRTHPKATLAIKSIEGLSGIPTSGESTFKILGDLTVHGVTLPSTWEAKATFSPTGAIGTATTQITFTDYKMTAPKMGPVLSIEDKAILEIDFNTAR